MPLRELYNLTTDPLEIHNLADEESEEADRWEVELEAWIAEKLAKSRRTEDPQRTQGITLGKKWRR